jgi:hypothetical protein
MKHMIFLLMLVVSLIVIWYGLQGRMPTRLRIASPGPTARPVTPAVARAPQVDPVGTVHRVIDSGHRLGDNTANAFERMNMREP